MGPARIGRENREAMMIKGKMMDTTITARELMRCGDLYAVPVVSKEQELRDVDGNILAKTESFEDAAFIAESNNRTIEAIRKTDAKEFDQVMRRIRNGTASVYDADWIEERMAPFVRR